VSIRKTLPNPIRFRRFMARSNAHPTRFQNIHFIFISIFFIFIFVFLARHCSLRIQSLCFHAFCLPITHTSNLICHIGSIKKLANYLLSCNQAQPLLQLGSFLRICRSMIQKTRLYPTHPSYPCSIIDNIRNSNSIFSIVWLKTLFIDFSF
jgi:hypothetical protein